MAKKVVQTPLSTKLGRALTEAVQEHADDAIYGQELPANVSGVAQLNTCYFGEHQTGQNQGERFFRASGTVVEPEEFEGQQIKGLLTSIGPEPLYETPTRKRKTLSDHVGWVLNELRKLGADNDTLRNSELEDVAEALVVAAPFFKFRTWKGEPSEQFPNPDVRSVWNGQCDYEIESSPSEKVSDDTGEPTSDTPWEDDASLGELAVAANDDFEAGKRLTELALKAGLSQDDINNAESWMAVLQMMEFLKEESPIENVEKEQVFNYQAPGSTEEREYEVTATFPKKRTCNLKCLEDGKSIKGVSWDDLRPVD